MFYWITVLVCLMAVTSEILNLSMQWKEHNIFLDISRDLNKFSTFAVENIVINDINSSTDILMVEMT